MCFLSMMGEKPNYILKTCCRHLTFSDTNTLTDLLAQGNRA